MIIEHNELITNKRSFYENSMATSAAMATIHEKKNDISYETTELILLKFHI